MTTRKLSTQQLAAMNDMDAVGTMHILKTSHHSTRTYDSLVNRGYATKNQDNMVTDRFYAYTLTDAGFDYLASMDGAPVTPSPTGNDEPMEEVIDQVAVPAPVLTKPAVCETCEGTGETSRLHFSGTFGAYEVFSKCPECGGKQIEDETWGTKADREATAYLKWLDSLSAGDVLYLKREADGRFMPEWVNVQVTRTSMINIDLVVLQETITKTGEHFTLGQEIRVVKRWHSILSGARPLSKSIILV